MAMKLFLQTDLFKSVETEIYLVFGVFVAEGEADRACGIGAQGLMGAGGAVEAYTGHDAVAALQLIGDAGVVVLFEVDRNDGGAALSAGKADGVGTLDRGKALAEAHCQIQLALGDKADI